MQHVDDLPIVDQVGLGGHLVLDPHAQLLLDLPAQAGQHSLAPLDPATDTCHAHSCGAVVFALFGTLPVLFLGNLKVAGLLVTRDRRDADEGHGPAA